MNEGSNLVIDDDVESNIEPFIFFQLAPDDTGSLAGRTSRPEFVGRQPWCVRWSPGLESVTISVTNAGMTASDLVVVDYQIIFCVYPPHGPQDGFTVSHAGEVADNQFDKVINAAVVPALGSADLVIDLTEYTFAGLANIYLRARVSTFTSEDLPYDRWDFAKDICVIEAQIRVAP